MPSEPRELQGHIQEGMILISWKPPAQPNGNITTYLIMYQILSSAQAINQWKIKSVNGKCSTSGKSSQSMVSVQPVENQVHQKKVINQWKIKSVKGKCSTSGKSSPSTVSIQPVGNQLSRSTVNVQPVKIKSVHGKVNGRIRDVFRVINKRCVMLKKNVMKKMYPDISQSIKKVLKHATKQCVSFN